MLGDPASIAHRGQHACPAGVFPVGASKRLCDDHGMIRRAERRRSWPYIAAATPTTIAWSMAVLAYLDGRA